MTTKQLIHYYVMLSCIVVLAISGSSIISYLTNTPSFFQLSEVRMALNTAISIFILAAALAVRSFISFRE